MAKFHQEPLPSRTRTGGGERSAGDGHTHKRRTNGHPSDKTTGRGLFFRECSKKARQATVGSCDSVVNNRPQTLDRQATDGATKTLANGCGSSVSDSSQKSVNFSATIVQLRTMSCVLESLCIATTQLHDLAEMHFKLSDLNFTKWHDARSLKGQPFPDMAERPLTLSMTRTSLCISGQTHLLDTHRRTVEDEFTQVNERTRYSIHHNITVICFTCRFCMCFHRGGAHPLRTEIQKHTRNNSKGEPRLLKTARSSSRSCLKLHNACKWATSQFGR